MKYSYDVPPRLKQKKGLAGNWENKDIGAAVLIGIAGILGMIVLNNISPIIGIGFLGICILFAWIMFLMPFKFGEPLRLWLERSKKFKKSQKRFYYVRKTPLPIYLDKNIKDENL